MTEAGPGRSRVRVDGKFFRRGAGKFHPRGVAYGPFAPNAQGEHLPAREAVARDFVQICELGANLVRVYHVPPRWLLDLAAQHDLLVLVDIPWDKHLCFLDDAKRRAAARASVREAVSACAQHPAVFAFSIANEIPPDIVRWSGAQSVADFLDELVLEARRIDPECLCTFANYPPTEFLRPQAVDFICFNVYLHQQQPFKNYLARLQMLADTKPLVLGEFGMDSIREGEPVKSETLRWQIEHAFRGGLAGVIVFSYTDDWYRDGRVVDGWEMGLTTRDRQPKPAFAAVREAFRGAPRFPLARTPRVSVVVASYNGERTLRACLESLAQLRYPDYEVILVDDGSTDATLAVAKQFPHVRVIRHEHNRGLSVARNTGIQAATGEIVAFTDSDCRADDDWLYYLVGDLLSGEFMGMGGHNLLPPEDSAVAAAVMVSPGGPAHVMLDDRQAEHIPGCNMAFYKAALLEVGGFDPIFTKAGDDVDLCWRLQQAGMKIGFSPAGFVWHYRRSNLPAYLKQQQGYGEAEALLVRKHPEYFNSFGDNVWRGRIYTAAKFGVLLRAPIIYRGLFGSAMFQTLYTAQPAVSLMLFTSLEYHLLVALPVWILAATFHPLLPLALACSLLPLGVCAVAGAQADLLKSKRRWWSRALVALLFLLQPLVRGAARYAGRLLLRTPATPARPTFDSASLETGYQSLNQIEYWCERRIERVAFVNAILDALTRQGWPHRSDIGWSEFDVELYGNRWSHVQLTTVTEDHPNQRQLLRCRLRARWSLQARIAIWTLAGLDLMVFGLFHNWSNWLGLLLLTLPLFAFFVHRQQRNQQSLVVVFLDQLAEEWKFIKIPAEFPGRRAVAKTTTAKPPVDSPFAVRVNPPSEGAKS
jgi:glycosyltransferase involved in cell wall biosynthesis